MAVDVSSHELADKRQTISTMSQSLTVHKKVLGDCDKQIGGYCRQLTMQKAEIELLSKSLASRESDRLSTGVGAADLAKRSKECEEVLLVTKSALLECENTVVRKEEEIKTLRKRIAIHENLPVCVAVTIGRDFDETLGDVENANLFDQTLQEDVGRALGVSNESVVVLCHQRASIIAELVLMADGDGKNPEQLAHELVRLVHAAKEGDVRSTEVGRFVKSAEVHGLIAGPVCKAVQDALQDFNSRSCRVGGELKNLMSRSSTGVPFLAKQRVED